MSSWFSVPDMLPQRKTWLNTVRPSTEKPINWAEVHAKRAMERSIAHNVQAEFKSIALNHTYKAIGSALGVCALLAALVVLSVLVIGTASNPLTLIAAFIGVCVISTSFFVLSTLYLVSECMHHAEKASLNWKIYRLLQKKTSV
jgi:hypothetical protein